MDEEFDCPVCATSQRAEGVIASGRETDFFRGYACVSCDAKLNLDATSGQLELRPLCWTAAAAQCFAVGEFSQQPVYFADAAHSCPAQCLSDERRAG